LNEVMKLMLQANGPQIAHCDWLLVMKITPA